VTKSVVKNVAASVRQRLLNEARATGRPFSELLQYFAMERFLYRLSKSRYADKFVLKGALMLTAWKAPRLRPTMDIDLLGRTDNGVAAMIAIVKEVCAQPVDNDDGMVFEVGTVTGERIAEAAEYEGVRLRFQGTLGTARVPMQLDVGFGDIVVPAAVRMKYPTILDLPAPELLAYSKESAVAEKLEAMVKLGELNSRMKDLFDIWLLARSFDFEGAKLRDAITKTFKRRGTPIPHDVPVALTEKFAGNRQKQAQWAGFVRRIKLPDVLPLSALIEDLRAFLLPPMHAVSSRSQYDLNWVAATLEWTGK
jgi:predicted nucleotidyltransferase component of viral defense system